MARRAFGRPRPGMAGPLNKGGEEMTDKYRNEPAEEAADGGTAPQAGSMSGQKDMNSGAPHAGRPGSQIASDATGGGSRGQAPSGIGLGNAANTASGLGPSSTATAASQHIGAASARPDAVIRNANTSRNPSIAKSRLVLGGQFRRLG